jgi:hypothetical protein
MYIERLVLGNVRYLDDREYDFAAGCGHLRRWVLLPRNQASSNLLRALALAGLGFRQVRFLAPEYPLTLPGHSDRPIHLESVQIRHAPQERGPASPVRRHSGWTIAKDGVFSALSRSAMRYRDPAAQAGAPESGANHAGRLLLGYSRRIQAHEGTDSFGIHPDQRVKRCAALFHRETPLTDPEAFLREFRRKSLYRAGRARALLARLNPDLSHWAGWDVVGSLDQEGGFASRWKTTPACRRLPLMVALDMVRHAYDASTHLSVSDPLQQPGIILLNAVESWCQRDWQHPFFELLDRWFPNIQFFIALSPAARKRFPSGLLNQVLEIPQPQPGPSLRPRRRLARGTVLLVDVDGTLPNLALMKLSQHYKARGRKVALARGVKDLPLAELALASCTFSTEPSRRRVEMLRQRFGDRLEVGGSGVDLRLRLAPEIEGLAPDYSLYPDLGDRAIGFLTRGCPQHCPFCLVPMKEGPPRLVCDMDTLLQGRKKLILLDDNLLAYPGALGLLEEIARRDLAVNFNQTLDLRRLTPDSAALLRRIRCSNSIFTRRNYHFSLNDARHLQGLRERYALLQTKGRDNVEFVCMYGFNTSLAEDVERFRFLRSLPGAYVFVQRYQPVPGGPPADPSRLFDERADALLDELVRVIFPQNMKSMETYYRWLAVQYAALAGRIHHRLVETLFRYNSRPRMSGFLHRLSELAGRTGAGASRTV